jgi:hypothetical protein
MKMRLFLGKTWHLWLLIPALALAAGWLALSRIPEGKRPPQDAVKMLDHISRTGTFPPTFENPGRWTVRFFAQNGLCEDRRYEFKGGWAISALICEGKVYSASLEPSDNDSLFPPWYKQAWWRAQRLVPSLPALPF